MKNTINFFTNAWCGLPVGMMLMVFRNSVRLGRGGGSDPVLLCIRCEASGSDLFLTCPWPPASTVVGGGGGGGGGGGFFPRGGKGGRVGFAGKGGAPDSWHLTPAVRLSSPLPTVVPAVVGTTVLRLPVWTGLFLPFWPTQDVFVGALNPGTEKTKFINA